MIYMVVGGHVGSALGPRGRSCEVKSVDGIG